MNNVFIKKLTQKESFKVYTKKIINIILINVINVTLKKAVDVHKILQFCTRTTLSTQLKLLRLCLFCKTCAQVRHFLIFF